MNTKNYTIYKCKDDRLRVYDKTTHKVTSYPRMLLEEKLGRKLESNEQVHHIDGNALNNDASNLTVMNVGDHQTLHSQKYYDKEMICPVCHNKFIWTAHQQSSFHGNSSRKRYASPPINQPFCSHKCAGYFIRMHQLTGTIGSEAYRRGENGIHT